VNKSNDHSRIQAGGPRLSETVFERVRDISRERPDAPALIHKRRGRWTVLRWADAFHTLEKLRARLQALGLGSGARVAVSGAYEPDLLLFALAASSAGAAITPVARDLHGEELRHLFGEALPTHAFVAHRGDIAHWVSIADARGAKRWLVARQTPSYRADPWEVVSLDDLLGETHGSVDAGNITRYLRKQRTIWVDEGTEWQDGLSIIVSGWLSDATAIAFPETAGSATRDRKTIQPTSILCSEARRQLLENEIEARLPAGRSWRRRIYSLSESEEAGPFGRLVGARVHKIFGLSRISSRKVREENPGLFKPQALPGSAGAGQ